MTRADEQPDAMGEIDIGAGPENVYALVSDPGVLAGLAAEYQGHRWLGGARRAEPGARFVGHNKKGVRRWMTVATITDASSGERFAFEISAGPMKAARWQYDIEATGEGCRVTESTWDKRPGWTRPVLDFVSGIKDRAAHNKANIDTTLRSLKERAEGA